MRPGLGNHGQKQLISDAFRYARGHRDADRATRDKALNAGGDRQRERRETKGREAQSPGPALESVAARRS